MTDYERIIEAMAEGIWIKYGGVPNLDATEAALSALLAAEAALNALLAALPEIGAQIVPKVATENMVAAWADNGRSHDLGGTVYRCPKWEEQPKAQKDWTAMLAAAPNPLEENS